MFRITIHLCVLVILVWDCTSCDSLFGDRGFFIRTPQKNGALMATDSDGLRKLNELYSLPKNCTETNMRASKVPEALFVCTPVVKSLSDETTSGVR